MPIPAYSEKISSIFQSSCMGGESLEEMIISPQNPEMELCFNRYVLRSLFMNSVCKLNGQLF